MAIFKSFGKNPSGNRLTIKQSPRFTDKGFENFSPTTLMMGRAATLRTAWKFFNKPSNTRPSGVLPSVKTDLKNITINGPFLVWFGHSSYFIRINGKNILVDPVLSGHASPFSYGANSFAGANVYSVADMPVIDLLILTHDHYDHLDHRTIIALAPKLRRIITPLGLGSHLHYWGISQELVTEMDWWDTIAAEAGIEITAAPARHFSGRSLKRNQTLWASFVLRTAEHAIYIGSDSGYDTHFQTIGERFGPFDLAILEAGQYYQDWPQIHMLPEEAVQAAVDLRAKLLLPVHWAKFTLAFHAWYEPPERVIAKAKELQVAVTTPMIGEPLLIGGDYPVGEWWVKYK